MIGKYLEILSDPFFWFMAAIAIAIIYWVYRKYVIGNPGVSEEVDLLQIQLARYGLTYMASQIQKGSQVSPLIQTPQVSNNQTSIYTYRTVQATDSNGKPIELWARFEYRNAVLAGVYFQPELG